MIYNQFITLDEEKTSVWRVCEVWSQEKNMLKFDGSGAKNLHILSNHYTHQTPVW